MGRRYRPNSHVIELRGLPHPVNEPSNAEMLRQLQLENELRDLLWETLPGMEED